MPEKARRPARSKIPIDVQVRVFFRDGWLCRWCHRPTVFAPAVKYLGKFVRDQGYRWPVAYYDLHWRRDAAPLLDHLGAAIDYVEAHSMDGPDDEGNLVTSCNKCNLRKSNRSAEAFVEESPQKAVKGKFGEPKHRDGLVSVFMVLAGSYSQQFTAAEQAWHVALQNYLATQSVPPQDGPIKAALRSSKQGT